MSKQIVKESVGCKGDWSTNNGTCGICAVARSEHAGARVKFPSIAEVAAEIRAINANVEGECDIRLQVWPTDTAKPWGNGAVWTMHTGDSQYDTDHRGFWGSSSVPGVVDGIVKRCNAREIARDLIDQARDMHAQSE